MKPTVPEVMSLVKAYYAKPGNSVGGNLHIVLDDGNIKDDHIRFCLEQCHREKDRDGEDLALLLLKMSKTQRKKLYAGKYDE